MLAEVVKVLKTDSIQETIVRTPEGAGGLLSPGFDKSHCGESGIMFSGFPESAITERIPKRHQSRASPPTFAAIVLETG